MAHESDPLVDGWWPRSWHSCYVTPRADSSATCLIARPRSSLCARRASAPASDPYPRKRWPSWAVLVPGCRSWRVRRCRCLSCHGRALERFSARPLYTHAMTTSIAATRPRASTPPEGKCCPPGGGQLRRAATSTTRRRLPVIPIRWMASSPAARALRLLLEDGSRVGSRPLRHAATPGSPP